MKDYETKNLYILDRFLYAFNVSPTLEQFRKLGGHLPSSCSSYRLYLDKLGYEPPKKATYRVLDTLRNNELVFIGATGEIMDFFGIQYNPAVLRKGEYRLIKNRYKTVRINIDKEMNNIFKDDLFEMKKYKLKKRSVYDEN